MLTWSESNHTDFSCFASSIVGVHTVFPFSSRRLSTRTTTRIVFIQYPCLSPAYSPIQGLDALCRTCPDDARFEWIHALQLPLELQQTPIGPVTTKSSPCVKPEVFLFLLWNRFLELHSKTVTPIFEMPLPTSFPIACCVSGTVHALLQQSELSFVLC